MFQIRRIHDTSLPADARAMAEAVEIIRQRVPESQERDLARLTDRLQHPTAHGYRSLVFVVVDARGHVRAAALVMHFPEPAFFYLDFIASGRRASTVGGIGAALYGRVREEARQLGVIGIFLDCNSDNPVDRKDNQELEEARRRLRFYERQGARPIVNPAWLLVFDDLGTGRRPSRAEMQEIARAILRRHYVGSWTEDEIAQSAASFVDDPVVLREPRYRRRAAPSVASALAQARGSILLVVNDKHDIHHVRDRGYLESPVRIASILGALEGTGLFTRVPPIEHAMDHIHAVHDRGMVEFLEAVCAGLPPDETVYSSVFPLRTMARRPEHDAEKAGFSCNDSFTPLHANVFLAARRGVDCALTAAEAVFGGQRFAYALVRPPGHHAERRVFGGFCYFNNTAIAAQLLSGHGRVAILDLDYHHGNGQQEIFSDRDDVLTGSIHGDPTTDYPFFTGYPEERGEGAGQGFNLNLVLPHGTEGPAHRAAIGQAIDRIRAFAPRFLVLALGLDPARGDPTGHWSLRAEDFYANGRLVRSIGLPTVIVQEGGYRIRSLGVQAARFFMGLAGV